MNILRIVKRSIFASACVFLSLFDIPLSCMEAECEMVNTGRNDSFGKWMSSLIGLLKDNQIGGRLVNDLELSLQITHLRNKVQTSAHETSLLYGSILDIYRGIEDARPDLNLKLIHAVAQKDYAGVQRCLEEGANANCLVVINQREKQESPSKKQRFMPILFIAITQDSPIMVELLLRHGADPDIYNKYCSSRPLTLAVVLGCPQVVMKLLDGGATVIQLNDDIAPPLIASFIGATDMTAIFLAHRSSSKPRLGFASSSHHFFNDSASGEPDEESQESSSSEEVVMQDPSFLQVFLGLFISREGNSHY